MGEALITRRGGTPDLQYVDGEIDSSYGVYANNIMPNKRYIVATAEFDEDSFTRSSLSLWLVDRGVVTALGGWHWSYSGTAYSREFGNSGTLSYSSSNNRLYFYGSVSGDGNAIIAVEIS